MIQRKLKEIDAGDEADRIKEDSSTKLAKI